MNHELSEIELAALEHVIMNKSLEPFFFEKIIKKNNIAWLEHLKTGGFFSNNNIPKLSEGNYVQEWNVLNYVKSVIGIIVAENDENNINYIYTILLHAAELSANFRVFYQTVDIITEIPLSYCNKEFLNKFINYWIDCEFGNDFILSKIESQFIPYLLEDNTKAYLIIEKFLSKYMTAGENSYYILDKIISNKQYLLKMFQTNPILISYKLIELLEEKSYKEFSVREINHIEYSLKIHNNQSYEIIRSNKVMVEKVFKTKQQDIEFIKNYINSIESDLDQYELDRTVKLLYGDLFDENASESIFDVKQYLFNLDDYFTHILKVCLSESSIEPTLLSEIINRLVKGKYDLLIKIAIYTIVKKFSDLNDLFYSLLVINEEIFDYVFRYYIFDDETKSLFQMLDNNIDPKYITIIEEIIDREEYIKHDWKDIDKWKQSRYKALNKITYFQEKYIEIKKITGVEVELIPAIRFSGAQAVIQKSPLSRKEIVKMSNMELIKIMSEFRETDKFSSDFVEVSYEGFGKELKEVFKDEPDRFFKDLESFNGLQYEFIYYFIDGFNDLMKQNIKFDHEKVLEFIILYTESDSFWHDDYRIEKENKYLMTHTAVLKEIFSYLAAYLSNDKFSLEKPNLEKLIKFVEKCFEKEDFSSINEVLLGNDDFSFYWLNSLGGRFVNFLLEWALKNKRMTLIDNEIIWESNIKVYFEKLLENNCIDVYIILGQLIGNFSYIDNKWVKQKLWIITPKHEMWEYFITGYLDSRTIYWEFYDLLKDHYISALEYKNFSDKNIKKRLGTHIIIGYLNGFEEKINYMIFNKTLEIWDTEIIEEMIRYCFSVENIKFAKKIKLDDVKLKILNFWSYITNKYSGVDEILLENAEVRLIRDSCHFLNNFNTINESIVKNIKFGFKYFRNHFDLHYITEYFKRLIQKRLEDGEKELFDAIFIEFFIECLPSHLEDNTILLDYLMTNFEKNATDEILQIYLENRRDTFIVKYLSKQN